MVDTDIIMTEQKQLTKMEENIATLFKKKTPREVILQRKGAGGKMFPYVPIDYVLSELNRVFGIFWEFVVDDVKKTDTSIIVRGKLVVKSPNGFQVSRPGVGRKALTFFKDSTKLVDEGNDQKGAVADAIKKAASLFGIAADVYYQELEKYEQIENQQTEDEAEKQKAMSRYFILANERGMNGELAKEKIKTAFKVKHMADLSVAQVHHASSLLEKNYEIVEPGVSPRKKGEAPKAVSPIQPQEVEEKAQDAEVIYYCKGPKHLTEPHVVTSVENPWCSKECEEAYYPNRLKTDQEPWKAWRGSEAK